MKHKYYLLAALALCLLLTACGHQHAWQAATCTTSKICPECGETDGEALGHTWIEATCTDAKVCSICLQTMGNPLGHHWQDATCAAAKTCSACANTEGSPLGHSWVSATCVVPETCTVCGDTQGEALGHAVEKWKMVEDSTCTQEGKESGICSTCGETCEQSIVMKEHVSGEWEITVDPTESSEGTRVKNCVSCGKEMEKEQFELSAEEIAKMYKKKCKTISYDTLSRRPGEYEGEYVKFSGKVVQVCSEASSSLYYSTYRVATSGSYDNVVYIFVDNYGSDERILEDDWITFYGKFDGLYTYETVLGASITIPKIIVEYID